MLFLSESMLWSLNHRTVSITLLAKDNAQPVGVSKSNRSFAPMDFHSEGKVLNENIILDHVDLYYYPLVKTNCFFFVLVVMMIICIIWSWNLIISGKLGKFQIYWFFFSCKLCTFLKNTTYYLHIRKIMVSQFCYQYWTPILFYPHSSFNAWTCGAN